MDWQECNTCQHDHQRLFHIPPVENFNETLKPRNPPFHFFPKNFPNPTLTCTVLIPGFGTVSPAFEICIYRTSTVHACSRKMWTPRAALDVKFTVDVPAGTSWLVNRVPPFNSRYGSTSPRVAKIHFSANGLTPAPYAVFAR